MASNDTPSPVRIGHRVSFLSDTGRRYGFVTDIQPAIGDATAVATVQFGNSPDDLWMLDVSDLTRVDNFGNPVLIPDTGDFVAALILLARSLRTDAAALMGEAGIPKTSEDRGRSDGYRGAAERIDSLLDTFNLR